MVRWLPSFRPAPPPPAAAPSKERASPVNAPQFRIESAARTHEGCVRAHNEDNYSVRDGEGLWAVADGMGGHEGGEWASGRIVDALDGIDTGGGLEAACEAAAGAIRAANGEILAEARARGKQMGSTAVVLIIQGPSYAVLWVGDSRAYLMRGGKLTQLSRDHSQVEEMVARGLMTPEQAVGHPMGHILSRAIGVQAGVEVDRAGGEIQAGDIFLLCSDGLHGVAGDAEIETHLAREAPDRALERLVALTLERGAPDNVTGIAVWASEPTLISFAESES
ncbi:MAG TPA: PP2C family serine/threonine-protein phosphatase [Allosphingosinicella sp.]|nr:PP2C family serine/threonine-protein phosphatase [Allosphingosinicella sp.]